MFLEGLFDLKVFIFLGFSISWIGGLEGLLMGGLMLFRKVFLSWLKFRDGLFFMSWLIVFTGDCEILVILGLLGFMSWFGFIFKFSGLFRGFFNSCFLSELSLGGCPSKEDLAFLFCE